MGLVWQGYPKVLLLCGRAQQQNSWRTLNSDALALSKSDERAMLIL